MGWNEVLDPDRGFVKVGFYLFRDRNLDSQRFLVFLYCQK